MQHGIEKSRPPSQDQGKSPINRPAERALALGTLLESFPADRPGLRLPGGTTNHNESRTMGPDPIQQLVQEDEKLTLGARVVAHWVEDGYYFHARARIVALRPRQVRVELLANSDQVRTIRPGRTLELPRIGDSTSWSSEQCVRLDGHR